MDTLLSIIIPHYNTPDLLKRLLDSIISEKREDTEVIVIDDHSTTIDEFQETKKQFPEVQFYTNHPQKKHAGAARNVGLEKAAGKWVLFADADDIFLPGWYNTVSEYFDQSYDIVYFAPNGKRTENDEEKEYKPQYKKRVLDYLDNPSETTENILRYCFFVPWSKLICRSIIDKRGIRFEEISYGEDALFSARCGAAAKTIYADKRSIYSTIENMGSMTHVKSREVYTDKTETTCRLYHFIRTQIGSRKAKELPLAHMVYTRLRGIKKNHYGMCCFADHIILFLRYRIPLLPSVKYAVCRKKA